MKPKILAVDDDRRILDGIKVRMELADYEIDTAVSGAEALRKIRSFHPDLVILDVMMPEMSGLDVCRTLKADSATTHIPVILLTAKRSDTDRDLGFELGADDYIAKPFSSQELLLRVHAILRTAPKKVC